MSSSNIVIEGFPGLSKAANRIFSSLAFEPCTIQIETNKLTEFILFLTNPVMNKVGEEFLKVVEKEISHIKTTKPQFKRDVINDLGKVGKSIGDKSGYIYPEANGYVYTWKFGVVASKSDSDISLWMKAMVIAYGMGQKSKAPGWTPQRLMAGPYRYPRWDGRLEKRKPSEVKELTPMPDSWAHSGNQYIESASRIFQSRYIDLVESLMRKYLSRNKVPRNVISIT